MSTAELKKAPLAVMESAIPRVAAAIRRIDRGELDAETLARAETGILGEQLAAQERTAARLAQRGRTAGGVAVISLRGFISPRGSLLSMILGGGSGGLEGFMSSLREAVGDSDIGSIVLDIDSPGGLVDLVPETAAAIREARDVKPITAVANTTAASAAYWLAAQATELAVTPSGEVGSIGVFASHEDWSKYDEELGVKTTLISAGKFKVEGNPYEELSDEAKAYMQSTVGTLYGYFTADVAAGRNVAESKVRGGYGEGRMLLAEAAVAEGMADRVATVEQVIASHVQGEGPGGGPATAGTMSADQARELLALPQLSTDERAAVDEALAGTATSFTFAGANFKLETPAPAPPPAPTPPPADPPPAPPPTEAEVEARRATLDMLYAG